MNLPAHARVLTGPDVWLESRAVDQLARIAALPACRCAVGLPDLHPGRGIPIGAVFDFEGEVRPRLVGGDAGCGVRLVAIRRLKYKGDALLRRLTDVMAGPALPGCDPRAVHDAVWRAGPAGLADLDGVPATLAALAAEEAPDPTPCDDDGPLPAPWLPSFAGQLGTVGGGNHFVELSRVERVVDKAVARRLGLTPGGWAVVAHSGSRGLGGYIAGLYDETPLRDGPVRRTYLARLQGALNYARANRLVLVWRILDAIGAARASRVSGAFDLVHNTVIDRGGDRWLHRKGAAPADAGQPTVVLGSRGTPSWVMEGRGRAETLCSVAHGAGRKMGRAEAVAKLRGRHQRRTLTRTALGGHVFCDDARLLLAEHPDAYKPIEPVIAALEADDAARRVASLAPFANFKTGGQATPDGQGDERADGQADAKGAGSNAGAATRRSGGERRRRRPR